jgi:phosphoglucomutase
LAATANNVQLVLANDPDADRLAAAEQTMQGGKGTGQFTTFSGNDIGLLLADWVWTNFRKQHPEVRWPDVSLQESASKLQL